MSTGSPRISVLMPVLNPHRIYFPEAVESILAQTWTDWELIIVEAPGQTSAAPLLAGYNDPRIRHVANPARTSLVAQRNQAVELARGEWLAMLDADDIAEPERLEQQLRFVENQACDVAGAQLNIIDGEGRVTATRNYPEGHTKIVSALRRFNPLAQSAVFARRAAVTVAGQYQYTRYVGVEDYELWCRMARAGYRFANLPERLVRYRVQSGQIKSQHMRDQLRGTLDIKLQHWQSELDWADRARMLGERALLWMPPRLVLALFKLTQLRQARN